MSGQPGAGCDDPRDVHPHWCGFCGAELLWTKLQCARLRVTPPCRRCGETDWRSERSAELVATLLVIIEQLLTDCAAARGMTAVELWQQLMLAEA